jgi:hypothetical protein
MSQSTSPCRLYVYLAREAPMALVLRRGPTSWVQLTSWQLDSDTLTPGQWLKGRVYERRCDLSPDGSLFVAFVRQTTGRVLAQAGADSWLAISRPPWLTALALWWIGTTYCAGGSFRSGTSLWLSGLTKPPDQGQLPPWLSLATELPYRDHTPEWTDRTVYFNRLLAQGWTAHPVPEAPHPTWERRAPDGTATLFMREVGGPERQEFEVQSATSVVGERLEGATWADWDYRGRLLVARDGGLWHWTGPGQLREIASFNDNVPVPEPSPPQARQWPRAPR